MKRRYFVGGLAATPLLTAPFAARATALYWKPPQPGDDVLVTSPATAWRNAFRQVPDSFDSTLPLRVPDGLRGTLYRNGPALMTLGGTRYRHWLDGDGMVHAFRFEAGRLRHRARMVGTHKLAAEREAGRRLSPGFGTDIPGAAAQGPGDMNVANISTLMLGGELLALWEGGAPHVLDPETLATAGRKSWSAQTDGLPFSAHPRVDANGTVWSFGYLPGTGMLALYQLGANGVLQRQGFVPALNADMVHDFAITERYLVFVLMPYRFDPTLADPARSFIGHYRWHAGQAATVLVVDKASFSVVRQVECDTHALFHLGNAWEHGNTLRLGIVNYPDFSDIMGKMGTALDGSMTAWPESRWTEFEVDLAAGTVRTGVPHAGAVEFPRFDPRRTGRASRYTYLLASRRDAAEPLFGPLFGFNTVRALDLQAGTMQEFCYGSDFIAEEHVFVPAPGGDTENRGWLVGTALDWKRRLTRVSIFDAAHVADGPIERVTLPYGLPLGLHGHFHAG